MNGHPVQIMAIRDLTDQRAVEERLRQAQKMEAVGQLAGGVAHDFNNILAAIMITAELALQDPAASGQLHEDIRSIHAAGRRGADITRQLLTFSRKQVTTPREVCLVKLLEEMQPMLDQLVMASTSIETRSNATSAVRADPIELEQIVLNLVVNARDAMPSGGVVIVETRDVQVAARTQDLGLTPGPYVLLSVTDTGVGIEESIRSKLFEPFFTTKPPGKGTGLGLSTVAGIVRSLDGAIRVHSVVGKGTTFEIFLPAITSAGDPEPEHHADEAARGRETILVVEDEIMVRTSIRRMLASLGYRVLEAKNGRDALLIRRRHPGPVHLVVTDIVMPEMTGPEMLQELRREEPGLPAVIISGYNDSVVDTKALPARTTFLPKPFKSHMLALKVREQIDQSFLEQPELDHGNLAAPAGSIA
jgi:nitrogen-specific signal transduction histidine kinase/ActR/RegA family two-component response regulator